MVSPEPRGRRRTLSWALYDWANSAFATVVMAGFFPVFFKEFWAADLSATDSTFWLGLGNSLASLLIVAGAPLLGALADRLGAKKRFLLRFTALGVVACGGLFLLAQGLWAPALALYLLGLLGFSGGNLFYDALLIEVAAPEEYARVSAFGYALGYLGGGLLFGLCVTALLLGVGEPETTIRYSFLAVALWWAAFSLPVALWVPETPSPSGAPRLGRALTAALGELRATLRRRHQLRETFLFLLAYWCYIDGVDTIVRMAVDYGLAIGFETNHLMAALLITQFIGFPAALVFGRIGQRWGARRGILLAIGVYLLVVLGASGMQRVEEFYFLAAVIGLVQGGIQALSRALFAGFVPPRRTAEFFGLFNMVGKFAAVLGPALVALTAALTGDPRLSLLPILLLFAVGAGLLWRVDVEGGRAAAGRYDRPDAADAGPDRGGL